MLSDLGSIALLVRSRGVTHGYGKEAIFMADPNDPVRAITSRGTISIDEKLTLRSLASVLAELDIGIAVVTRPDGSVGIVSERDVVRALADGGDADEVWTADVMADNLVLAEPEETIVAVSRRMSAEGVRHVAIVERGTIIGVVSARDVLPVLAEYVRETR